MKYKLLLLFTIATTFSSTNSDICLNIVPGVGGMLGGIDITKFNVRDPEFHYHMLNAVLRISCDSNVTWSNSHFPDETFLLPDQISQFSLNEKNDLHSPQILLAHDMIEMRNVLLSTNSPPPSNLIGAFSRSRHYKSYLHDYYRQNKSYAVMSAQVSLYDIVLKPPSELLLGYLFVNNVNNLASKYEQNPTVYREFIKMFGTHYIERAKLGGLVFWEISIPDGYYRNTTDEDIEDNLKASFFTLTKQKNVTMPKSYEAFRENVGNSLLSVHTLIGGESLIQACSSLESCFFDDPYGNAYSSPGFTEYSLRPLEDLITDENIKAQFKVASEMYQIEAYLNELKAVYKAASWYKPSDDDRVQLNKLEDFVNSSNSMINRVQAVQMIDHLYNKVKDVDKLITDYVVTAALKLQFAHSICDRSADLCPSRAIKDENREFEQLNYEYQSSKANGKYFTREMYSQFGRKAQVLGNKYRVYVDLDRGLGASCGKC